MKNVQLFLLSLIIVLIAACKPGTKTPYNKNGIAFTVPAGWKITDDEENDSTNIIINVEKSGATSSGLLGISCIFDSIATSELVETYKSSLRENRIYKTGNVKIFPGEQGRFGHYDALILPFEFSLLSVAHRGRFYIFHHRGKSYILLRQEAVEDTSRNETGFAELEKTFMLK